MNEKRKVVLVGTGFVGMSAAYSLLNQGGIDELVLVDLDTEKAIGEAMDLNHGLAYAPGNVTINAGSYDDCKDAAMVIITAGAAQKEGQTRLDLTKINTRIMKGIVESIMKSGFDGIMLIASNPVDLMSYVAWKVSGLPRERVIGSGTTLDTARLRYLMSKYLNVSTNNIHAYIMGEHGDSSFVPWTHSYVGCKNLLEILDSKNKPLSDLHEIYSQVQQAAYEIISRKRATYYGIGLALARIVHAILDDENVILTVSTYLDGEYGHEGIYIGVPAVVNRDGVKEIMELDLNSVDKAKFDNSCKVLNETIVDEIEEMIK
ncbi:MAG: L-lactate dehydrogenase [Erysipelotrichaceae bacterium]